MHKILKTESEVYKKIEALNRYLLENNIEIYKTVYNGVIYKIDGKFYKNGIEGEYTDSIPPWLEGNYILCDENGNTDYYN